MSAEHLVYLKSCKLVTLASHLVVAVCLLDLSHRWLHTYFVTKVASGSPDDAVLQTCVAGTNCTSACYPACIIISRLTCECEPCRTISQRSTYSCILYVAMCYSVTPCSRCASSYIMSLMSRFAQVWFFGILVVQWYSGRASRTRAHCYGKMTEGTYCACCTLLWCQCMRNHEVHVLKL
jgi:hypothetical protein